MIDQQSRHERDAQIVAALRTGASLAKVGARFGLSRSRIAQIAANAGLNLAGRHHGRTHGVSGYVGGCRCETCRRANRERQQQYRAQVEARPIAEHGLNAYTYQRCRCPVCRAAKAEQNRRQRLRRDALRASG